MDRLHTILKIKSYGKGLLTFSDPCKCSIGNRIMLTDHKNRTLDTLIVDVASETEVTLDVKAGDTYSNYSTVLIVH